MTDSIVLEGLSFYGYHGVRSEEKSLGQRFLVDVVLSLDLAPAGRSDDLTLALDYAEAYRVIREQVEGPSRDTLEAVAEETARALFGRFQRLEAVTVRVKKPNAPIPGSHFCSVGVEIERRRGDGSGV